NMKLLTLLATILITVSVQGQINIIPKPVSVKQPKTAANFSITPSTQIVLEGSKLDGIAEIFNDYLQQFYRFKLKIVKTSSNNNSIILNFDHLDNSLPGAYQITVDNKGVYIGGDNEEGVFYGVQTLIQLLPVDDKPQTTNNKLTTSGKLQIPYVSINDYPRFAYRGMHLDCGRHFFPVSFIKKYIDYIALHKMNYFHWHLTEDQGWRIEIKKYPKLTQVGAWRNGTIIGRYPGMGNDETHYGGYYTQDEIKDVVAYAAKRFITVVPEIEMPGHSSAAIAAYPYLSCFPNESTKHPQQCAWSGDSTGKQVQQTWGVFPDVFCAGKDSTFKFLEDVLDEVMALFPSKYIHVGGDESPKANWKRCTLCQQRIKDEHLKNEEELQSYFIQRIEKYLNSKGRTLIGWDEILEGGIAPNAVIMSWRGEAGGIAAARQKHNVIMTPGGWVYLDHSQSQNEDSVTIGGYTSLDKTYSYEPVSDSLTKDQGKYILGAQGNVWTEYMGNERKVEYMIFPRMSALSEVLWSQKDLRDSADFEKRLETQFKRYDLWGANYSKAIYDLKGSVLPSPDNNGVLWKLEGHSKNGLIAGAPNSVRSSAVVNYTEPIKVLKDTTVLEMYFIGDRRVSSLLQQFYINKATGKKITLTTQPARIYQGDGAFTLVNGVQNEKGLEKPKEFLGFNGTDCDAVIDLGSVQQINNVKAHVFEQTSSWVWRPKSLQVFISTDSINYSEMGTTDKVDFNSNKQNGTMTVEKNVSARYIKIKLSNFGTIPSNNPGEGNKAWLFVDEIEVN
ncbi:MAG TPA: beta-N-acetylhexosaminidase, partial [Chitinophagaceae bacterium]